MASRCSQSRSPESFQIGDFRSRKPYGFSAAEPTSLLIAAPDGDIIGLSSHRRNLDLFGVPTGNAIRRHTIPSGEMTAADFSAKAAWLLWETTRESIYFQDQEKRTIAYTQCASDSIVQLTRASAGEDQYAFISESGKLGAAVFPGRIKTMATDRCDIVGFSPDQQTMVVAARSGQLRSLRH